MQMTYRELGSKTYKEFLDSVERNKQMLKCTNKTKVDIYIRGNSKTNEINEKMLKNPGKLEVQWDITLCLLDGHTNDLSLRNQMLAINSNSISCHINHYNHLGNNLNIPLPSYSVYALSRAYHEYIFFEMSTEMLIETFL